MTDVGDRLDRHGDTRQRLLLTALHLYDREGLHAVSLRRISTEAGSRNSAAMHYHFDNKLGVIQALLDKEINRSIANHGGKISIVEIRQGKLYISMSGGCQGCASSQVTLRQGFKVMLKRVAPEIKEIVDTTNHAAGKQPFYPRHEEPL